MSLYDDFFLGISNVMEPPITLPSYHLPNSSPKYSFDDFSFTIVNCLPVRISLPLLLQHGHVGKANTIF